MNIMKRIVPFLSLPLALFMLVTGVSFISKSKQEGLEAELAKDLEQADRFEPVFRFAVATDVHINANDDTTTRRLEKMLETAYAYSDAHETYNSLDAVILTGDNCDSGSDAEYAILNGVLHNGLRNDTQLVTVQGNHEFGGTGHEGYVRNMGEDLDKHVVIKGFHFIGLSPDPSDTWHTPSQIIWMAKELRKAAKADPDKPIFTMQHGHIWNTVYVSRSWKTQMSLPLHLVYSMYPQVVNFSGHSHGPINNPIDIWQNSYTLVGAGTLNYFEMEDDIGDETVPAGARNAAQYFIVEVDKDNRILFKPYNLLTDEFMKTPSNNDDPDKQLYYYVNDAQDTSNYVYTSARKKTASVPYFEDDAEISVNEIADGKVSITFPQAKDDICVYGYRIILKDKSHPLRKIEKEIYSEYYFEPMPDTLSVTIEGLTAGTEYEISVIPLNVWLAKGDAIKTDINAE